jgi:hypothetical protein
LKKVLSIGEFPYILEEISLFFCGLFPNVPAGDGQEATESSLQGVENKEIAALSRESGIARNDKSGLGSSLGSQGGDSADRFLNLE